MQQKLLLRAVVALSVASFAAAQATTTSQTSQTAAQTTQTSQTTQATQTTPSSAGPLPDLSSTSQSSSSASTSSPSTTSAASTSSSSSASTTQSVRLTTSNGVVISLTGLPTINGAGIPTMIVPYTANAPYMQESDLPEGTVFIAVGAVLAFLGACVLLWRGLVAWSINRSVKRAALASIRNGNEKTSKNWGGSSTGYNSAKSGMYKDMGGSVSMEALTPNGKQIKSPFKDYDTGRSSTPPPSNLFFSPTAQARTHSTAQSDMGSRTNSAYLPAGYYAQPSSHVANGARNTTLGAGNAAPYARHSNYEASPPASPAMRPLTGTRTRPLPDQMRASASRDEQRHTLRSQPSNSSLAVGIGGRPGSSADLGGQRAPSAYLDDLFENHTAMAKGNH